MFILVILLIAALNIFLIWYLLSRDQGPQEPFWALMEAAGYGAAAFVLAAWIERLFFGARAHQFLLGQGSARQIATTALVIALVEEVAKFLPLAIFLHRRPFFNEYTDGVIYFAIAGISFSVLEDGLYLSTYGGQLGLVHVTLLLFFHAATAGIVGYYFASAKLNHQSLAKTLVALGDVVLIHALYDYSLIRGTTLSLAIALLITIFMNVALFWYYHLAWERDTKAKSPISQTGSNA